MVRPLATFGLAALAWSCGGYAQERVPSTPFAETIRVLSEPGGYFDTDNLISNERSYLHVLDALARIGVTGGAYIGVGPDQNFSYIAQIRPRVAYLIDIRRDNMVMHLMFKAIFELAPSRVDFLSVLVGRVTPADQSGWSDWTIDELVIYFDSASANPNLAVRARAMVDSAVTSFGVELSEDDWRNLDRFHKTFMRDRLSLRFTSHGRSPRSYYPTYRDLLLERSMSGERANYLTSSARYRVVRDLQVADRVIPVVGDLSGEHALRAIGRDVKARGLTVSGFYASNVEFYLFGSSTCANFVRNVRTLPVREESMMIRSVFRNPYGGGHPLTVPGYASTQMLQSIEDLLRATDDGAIRSYWDLLERYIAN